MYTFSENFEPVHSEHVEIAVISGETGHKKSDKKENFILNEIKDLLNTNASSIITVSISIAIGTSFNNAIMSFISDIIHPLAVKFILFSGIHNFLYDIDQIIGLQKTSVNVGIFISSILSFLLLCLLCYQINTNLMKYL